MPVSPVSFYVRSCASLLNARDLTPQECTIFRSEEVLVQTIRQIVQAALCPQCELDERQVAQQRKMLKTPLNVPIRVTIQERRHMTLPNAISRRKPHDVEEGVRNRR